MDKVGMIKLPEQNTPTQGVLNNLHGFWTPHAFVKEFWATGAIVEFSTDADYEEKKNVVCKSYEECIRDFYRENAL